MKGSAQSASSRPGAVLLLVSLALLASGGTQLAAQSLRGSPASLDRQNAQASAHDFSYLRTPDQVRRFVDSGYLVPVGPTRDMDLHAVSFPYARPEVRVFVQRLASQYHAACGEKLVVTSLTRPTTTQPANASSRSVHPTGMAVDLRRSNRAACRQWLESTLLSLEDRGVVEATRENRPPHYHLVVFPQPYSSYLASITGDEVETFAEGPQVETRWVTHRVDRGETLTAIASRYGSSVSRLRAENGLRSDRLMVGQSLKVPTMERVVAASDVRADASAAEARSEVSFASSDDHDHDADRGPELIHTVQRGESLWVIARRFGVDEAAIRRANGLSGSRIDIGQELSIPSGSTADGSEPISVTHTVSRGESLWTIARAYGIDEGMIRAVNGLSGNRIVVGQSLTIPTARGVEAILQHTVARGESLWTIANRHGTTVDEIRRTNGMDTTRIYAGQVLEVPVTF